MLIHGDCLEEMKKLPENSVDSIVTDPPYELGFMGKSWDNTGIANNPLMWAECLRVLKPGGHLLAFSGTRTYHRMACAIEDAGFEVRDMIEWIYASGFPKSLNVHKQLKKSCTCGNMEAYEQGTKTLSKHDLRPVQEANISQEINPFDKQGEVLQSGLSEQSTQGTVYGGEPEESSPRGKERILEGRADIEKTEGQLQGSDLSEMPEGVPTNGEEGWVHNATQVGDGSTSEPTTDESGSGTPHRPQSEQQPDREPCAFCKQWGTQATRTLGIGTALKPAHEPICMARKPLAEKTVAENCLKWGTGGINIDESRVEAGEEILGRKEGTPCDNVYELGINKKKENRFIDNSTGLGRFPANLIHDNSEEVRECFPETKSQQRVGKRSGKETGIMGAFVGQDEVTMGHNDSGNASRFFKSIIYNAKASKSERNKGCEGLEEKEQGTKSKNERNFSDDFREFGDGEQSGHKNLQPQKNFHPTVKPIALMEYLITMVTPKGGTVLDPFMGSGSTGVACRNLDRGFIGIDMTAEYIEIAKARIESVYNPNI